MRRSARNDEFRSNFHRGGKVEKVELEPDYEDAAIKAANAMGLTVAGVDMLESNEGPKIMELNASPGLEGIEGATNVNIARALIEYLEEQV
jgi:ribosomal protein S6--L-glutamate ligase